MPIDVRKHILIKMSYISASAKNIEQKLVYLESTVDKMEISDEDLKAQFGFVRSEISSLRRDLDYILNLIERIHAATESKETPGSSETKKTPAKKSRAKSSTASAKKTAPKPKAKGKATAKKPAAKAKAKKPATKSPARLPAHLKRKYTITENLPDLPTTVDPKLIVGECEENGEPHALFRGKYFWYAAEEGGEAVLCFRDAESTTDAYVVNEDLTHFELIQHEKSKKLFTIDADSLNELLGLGEYADTAGGAGDSDTEDHGFSYDDSDSGEGNLVSLEDLNASDDDISEEEV